MNTQSKPQGYKRRIYFIEKKFQAAFLLKFCGLVAVGGLLTIGALYLLALNSTTVAIVNSRVVVRTTADFILPVLVQTVAVVTVIVGLATLIVTLLVSHKLAGPLYRFKKVIQALEDGDFSANFKIRQRDQMQDVAAAFNDMISVLRGELNQLKGDLTALREQVSSIQEDEVSEHKRAALTQAKKIAAELNRIITFFKT